MRKDGELTYLHTDHLGSASLSTSATGAKVSEMRYYAYGGTRSGTMGTDRQYTGQRWEAGIGLYDYNARYYDPALGRFVQADTVVPSPHNSQSFNRYLYTLGNPLRFTDPSGHWQCDGDDCREYVQWILDTMRLAGPVGKKLVKEFLKYDKDELDGEFLFKFDIEMSGSTECGAGSTSMSCKFDPSNKPKEDAIPDFAHEMRHVLDGIATSIQDETRAYQTQFRVAEEYVAWAEMGPDQREDYLVRMGSGWLYPGGYKDVRKGNFMALDPESREDLEVARAMIVSWAPNSNYADETMYPTFRRSWIEWQPILFFQKVRELFEKWF
jgi:RHS repeat-associated protein